MQGTVILIFCYSDVVQDSLLGMSINNVTFCRLQEESASISERIYWSEKGLSGYFLDAAKQIISNQPHNVKKSEFRNLGNFACGTRNCLGFGIGNTAPGIWNPVPEIQNPVTGILNLRRGMKNPRLPWISLHVAILLSSTWTKFETVSFGS